MNRQDGTPESALGPVVAGTWYPEDRAALEAKLETFLTEADASAESPADRAPESVAALIVPHAGYAYSGAVAARGFRRLRGKDYDRVILLGPSHFAFVQGAVVPRASVYRTPLGEVELDAAGLETFSSRTACRVDDGPFRPEHSLEAEIPFLQHCLKPGWRLLPVLVGTLGSDSGEDLAAALRPMVGPRTLVVVSSDFTHFGPRFEYVPFDRDVPKRIEELDMGAVKRILDRDVEGFRTYVEGTGATICGRNPIQVLMRMMDEPREGYLAGYDTSGRLTGDWTHSVSYASLVFGPSDGKTT